MLIAIPSASGEIRRASSRRAARRSVPVKTLPALHELIAGDLNLAGQIRPVQVEDVLGREQVEVDLGAVAGYVRDKTVLVTGAGGSIGSRAVPAARAARRRAAAARRPGRVGAVRDRARARRTSATSPPPMPVLANCGDRAKMQQVFERYRPQVVFHAAAYKHVRCSRRTRCRRCRTTSSRRDALAEVAVEFGVERFVLISTDKAANPKNVMGQSKAVCEWIVESFARATRRRDAVRRGSLRQRPRLVRAR